MLSSQSERVEYFWSVKPKCLKNRLPLRPKSIDHQLKEEKEERKEEKSKKQILSLKKEKNWKEKSQSKVEQAKVNTHTHQNVNEHFGNWWLTSFDNR